jgi:hypothetical protein
LLRREAGLSGPETKYLANNPARLLGDAELGPYSFSTKSRGGGLSPSMKYPAK